MVNRAALLLRYKQPAVDWINEVDPAKTKRIMTLDEVNTERTVYLIGDAVAESSDKLHRWIRRNFSQLFEMELNGWYTDRLYGLRAVHTSYFRPGSLWNATQCSWILSEPRSTMMRPNKFALLRARNRRVRVSVGPQGIARSLPCPEHMHKSTFCVRFCIWSGKIANDPPRRPIRELRLARNLNIT